MSTPRAQCEVSLTVNGKTRTVRAYPMERLLDVLRHQLGLTGAKEGCGEGECGSCSVLMDGALVNSCLVPVLQAQGAKIVTIEGLANGDRSCTHCSRRFSIAAARSAASARRASSWRPVIFSSKKPQPDAGRHQGRACGQSLPMHGVCADLRSGCEAAVGEVDSEKCGMRSDPADYELVAPGSLSAVVSLLAQSSRASGCRSPGERT